MLPLLITVSGVWCIEAIHHLNLGGTNYLTNIIMIIFVLIYHYSSYTIHPQAQLVCAPTVTHGHATHHSEPTHDSAEHLNPAPGLFWEAAGAVQEEFSPCPGIDQVFGPD
jgi:hypothetical protein